VTNSSRELHQDLRAAITDLCCRFPDSYWRELDAERAYPEAFVQTLTEAGYLGALIPEEYGGSGLGLGEASIILEEINRAGGNAAACHAQMYVMGTLLRHGSAEQKQTYLPQIAAGRLRLQAFAVTEPTTGTNTTQLKTVAVRTGDRYVVNGQKVWISRAEHSDLMLLVARTTPLAEVSKRTDGLSVFLVDLRSAVGNGLTIRPVRTMMNHSTTEVFSTISRCRSRIVSEKRETGFGICSTDSTQNGYSSRLNVSVMGDGSSSGRVRMPRTASYSSVLSAKTRGSSFRSHGRMSMLKPPIS